MYRYNGKNYNNDSTRFYRWTSVQLFKDRERNRLLYIYSVSGDGKNHESRKGFGVSYFDSKNAECNFTEGYFLDADRNAMPRNLRFIRARDLARKLSFDLTNQSKENLSRFIARLVEYETINKTPVF